MPPATETYLLLLAVLAPLAGAIAVMLTGRRPNVRESCSFIAAAVTLAPWSPW